MMNRAPAGARFFSATGTYFCGEPTIPPPPFPPPPPLPPPELPPLTAGALDGAAAGAFIVPPLCGAPPLNPVVLLLEPLGLILCTPLFRELQLPLVPE